MDALSYRFPRSSRVVKARPRTLVEDGKPNRRLMRRELMTDEELLTQLRLRGIEDLSEGRCALLEPNGMVSVVVRDGAEPDEPDRPPAVGRPAGSGSGHWTTVRVGRHRSGRRRPPLRRRVPAGE